MKKLPSLSYLRHEYSKVFMKRSRVMLEFLTQSVITPLLPLFLGTVGIILYFDLKFFPFVKIKALLSSLFKDANGSSWRALSVALAGTLGVGNIIGVAFAITAGGAGALFWMWVSALLAMIIKYSETLLAIRHRKTVACQKNVLPVMKRQIGGAMYYIPHKPFARLFAILCIASSFTVGNLLQTNAVSEAFTHSFSLPPYIIGLLFSLLTIIVIWRGIGRITKFCSVVIPFLSTVYLLMCASVIVKNVSALPSLFGEILAEAFSLRAIEGGVMGSALFQSMRIGFAKGLITNEAGCGTAPIAHASADTESAVKQGFLGVIEVFFDTIVLCTASGLVLLLAHREFPTLNGYALVSSAFSGLFGRVGDVILSASLFFFVLATLVGWSFYGKSALEYFTENQAVGKLYLILFSIVAFLGTIGSSEIFWQLSDLTVGLMTFINTGYLLYFRCDIRLTTEAFFKTKTRLTQKESKSG